VATKAETTLATTLTTKSLAAEAVTTESAAFESAKSTFTAEALSETAAKATFTAETLSETALAAKTTFTAETLSETTAMVALASKTFESAVATESTLAFEAAETTSEPFGFAKTFTAVVTLKTTAMVTLKTTAEVTLETKTASFAPEVLAAKVLAPVVTSSEAAVATEVTSITALPAFEGRLSDLFDFAFSLGLVSLMAMAVSAGASVAFMALSAGSVVRLSVGSVGSSGRLLVTVAGVGRSLRTLRVGSTGVVGGSQQR